jgi:hypothetical protein
VTGLNSAQPSCPLQNNSSGDGSVSRKLDPDTKGRFVGLLGLAALSLWIVVSISSNLYFSIVSAHWPKATARVTSSGVYSNGKGVGVSWTPKVEYAYEAGGSVHHSSKIRYLMRAFYDVDSASEVQASYPEGRVVSVAYDPQDPSQSVLEPGLAPGMWTQGLIPLFFCGLCGYIFFEITNPHRRVLLRSNPVEADFEDEGKGSDEAEMA